MKRNFDVYRVIVRVLYIIGGLGIIYGIVLTQSTEVKIIDLISVIAGGIGTIVITMFIGLWVNTSEDINKAVVMLAMKLDYVEVETSEEKPKEKVKESHK